MSGLRGRPYREQRPICDHGRLYFDTRWCGEHGIGRFAREVQAGCPEMGAAELAGSPTAPIDCLRTALWLLRRPNTLLFSPGYNAPMFLQSRAILCVHDLNHIDAPTSSSRSKRLFYALVLKRACRHSLCIFTVSDYSRQRILDWSGADPARVINVGNGVSPIFSEHGPTADEGGVPFLLCVSNRKPHKNEARMLEAFWQADLPAEARLVITGLASESQKKWLKEKGLDQRVRFLGALDDATLAGYYRGARGLVFVSSYEGFGLPAIEAMASGTPALVSCATSLPEVVGNAALLCDPHDVDDIRAGFERLWYDEPLRGELRARGLERAGDFEWSRVVDRIRGAIGYHRGG